MTELAPSPLTPDAVSGAPTARMNRAPDQQHKKAADAAQQFESVFLSKMLEGMSTGLSGTILSGGQAEDTRRSFMNDEYAKLISRSGGIGVAKSVMETMLGAQEVS